MALFPETIVLSRLLQISNEPGRLMQNTTLTWKVKLFYPLVAFYKGNFIKILPKDFFSQQHVNVQVILSKSLYEHYFLRKVQKSSKINIEFYELSYLLF